MRRTWLLGVLSACLFIALASVRLDRQGLYYDEAHQAVAAFDYLGRHSPSFNREVFGVPVLSVSYTGAIKSNVYGIYLRFVDSHFTVQSWRMLGIVFASAGLLGFFLAAGDTLPGGAALLFAALILTDSSLLLTVRHDWGPVALNLALRLVFVGLWLRAASRGLSNGLAFWAGCLVGVALFEKLSAVVLIVPAALLLFVLRPTARRVMTAAVGFLVGSLPLTLLNVASFLNDRHFVSLESVDTPAPLAVTTLLRDGFQFLAIGAGRLVRGWILNAEPAVAWSLGEASLLGLALLFAVVFAMVNRRDDRAGSTMVGALVVAYVTVAVGLVLLPNRTWVHHWVTLAPFHYAAIAVMAGRLRHGAGAARRVSQLRVLVALLLAAWLGFRVASLASTESALLAGRASHNYAPGLSQLGRFAAAHASEAAFVSVDWGTGTQVYCFTDGVDDVSYDTADARDPSGRMRDIASATAKDTIYLMESGIVARQVETARAATRAMEQAPGWGEVPVEDELRGLDRVQVRRFVRLRPVR